VGKGTLIKLLTLLMGANKVLETTKPNRDVWGDFNGMMATSYLVNLNELSKKDTIDNIEQIKGLITDASFTINTKGINQYKIISYHRFIITTNSDNPIETKEDERRNAIIRSSVITCYGVMTTPLF
jgi:phage/plasmid-associated DNA primase